MILQDALIWAIGLSQKWRDMAQEVYVRGQWLLGLLVLQSASSFVIQVRRDQPEQRRGGRNPNKSRPHVSHCSHAALRVSAEEQWRRWPLARTKPATPRVTRAAAPVARGHSRGSPEEVTAHLHPHVTGSETAGAGCDPTVAIGSDAHHSDRIRA